MDDPNKHLYAKIGQYVLISNDKNEILLLERLLSKKWPLPGGRLDKKDRGWEKALAREVKEETGLLIENLQPFDIKLIEDPYQIKYCVYHLASSSNVDDLTTSNEHSASRWVTKVDIDKLSIDDSPAVKQMLEKYFLIHKDSK
ncbi:NUDIX hydrolase [Patescibacteria group bacterium]